MPESSLAQPTVRPPYGMPIVLIALTLLAAGIAFFVLGIVNALALKHDAAQAAISTIGFVVVVTCQSMAVRRLITSLAVAAFEGAVAGVLAVVAFPYGMYVAYLAGWNSLDVTQFGSDDYRGQRWIAISVELGVLPLALVGALVAALIWAASRRASPNGRQAVGFTQR